MIVDMKKVKGEELDIELALYKKAGIKFNWETNFFKKKALVERLIVDEGYPFEITEQFLAENEVLGKFFISKGAKLGDIVFGDDADFTELAKMEGEKNPESKIDEPVKEITKPKPTTRTVLEKPLPVPAPEYHYMGKLVINIENRIIRGRIHKDVKVSSGETFTLTTEQFNEHVK